MPEEQRFRVNAPEVVAETVADEAIVLNLGTGMYYSIKGDSVPLWHAISGGASAEEIAGAVCELTGENAEAASAAIIGFIASLEAEGLIVERNGEAEERRAVDLAGAGAGLLEPGFETYSDMRDLILLDPVHEVDERGWPHARPTP